MSKYFFSKLIHSPVPAPSACSEARGGELPGEVIEQDNIDDIGVNFTASITFAKKFTVTKELVPGGSDIPVTRHNLQHDKNLFCSYYLNEIEEREFSPHTAFEKPAKCFHFSPAKSSRRSQEEKTR